MQTHRLPLTVQTSNRDETTNKDARIVNAFIEVVSENESYVYKRPGFRIAFLPQSSSGKGLGAYNWYGNVYTVLGSGIYKNGILISGMLDIDSTNIYTFSACIGDNPVLFLHNRVKAYTISKNNVVTEVTQLIFAIAEYQAGSAYLDGYMFIVTAGSFIYNSAVDNPLIWTPANYIRAQIEPDLSVFIAKQQVYVIVFKQWSIEVFYDAGNNAPASPLSPVQGAKVNVGCRDGRTVQYLEGILIWVSQTRDGGTSVYMMENLKVSIVSTAAIDRLLQQANFGGDVYSWVGRISGHRFYVLTLPTKPITLVYDLVSRLWYQWSYGTLGYFPFCAATYDSNGQLLVQNITDGKLYKLEMTYTSDILYGQASSSIDVNIYTPNFDGGTRTRKYIKSIEAIADQVTGSSVLTIRHTDDDYQTWSNFRSVELGRVRPRLIDCGTFRRRAWHIRHTGDSPLRIQSIELLIDGGTI